MRRMQLFKVLIVVAVLLLAVTVVGCGSEKRDALEAFESAVKTLEAKNSELIAEANLLQELIDASDAEPPLDSGTLSNAENAVATAKQSIKDIPETPSDIEAIKTITGEMEEIGYAEQRDLLEESKRELEESVQQYRQVTNTPESFVIERLKRVKSITGVAATTEDNDPNGQLGKLGGYTASVFFSDSKVNKEKLSSKTIIKNGTDGGGCIEVYETVEGAEKRNEYLASFDGTILASGYHEVIGTVLVRTSNELKASQQKSLAKEIIDSLIALE